MNFDDIIERALGVEAVDTGTVRAYQTVAGRLQLTDGDAWLTSDAVVDLSEVR